MHRRLSLASLAIVTTWPMQAQDNILGPGFERQPEKILAPVKPWDLLGQGYQLTGDSAVDKDGIVYFTDARRNQILKIDLEGKISIWKEGSNVAHGIAFGPDGRLYAGQHDRKRIVAFSSDGTESVIAEGVQSHHLTVTSRNEIYFSEPPAHKVWMVDAVGHKRVVHEGINWPRAVRVSADQSRLVVDDPPTRWVWLFQIEADGSLVNGRPFYRLETGAESSETDAGGMAFDSEGFLYVATKPGVQIFDPLGRVIAIVSAPGSEGVSSVFFGGPGLHWLYVTDGDKVYRLPVKRSGVGPWNASKPLNSADLTKRNAPNTRILRFRIRTALESLPVVPIIRH
jgi:sugar lactone lactonase YvrE